MANSAWFRRVMSTARSGIPSRDENSVGVLRVLSEEPVRFLDLPDIDDTVVDRFMSSRTDLTFDDFGGLDKVKARARSSSRRRCCTMMICSQLMRDR